MPTAALDGTVIADASIDDVLHIEGNVSFAPSSVRADLLQASPTPYTCPWKAECQYYSVRDGEDVLKDRAWAYPHPYPTAFERVGTDFGGYVAFSKGVQVG
jgi:uncharacterized protein (DUF427 family)